MTYPEHDKLKALAGLNEVVGSFLEWLDAHGLIICERTNYQVNDLYMPTRKSFEALIAEFFEIDMKALEAEKREMLAQLRASHSA